MQLDSGAAAAVVVVAAAAAAFAAYWTFVFARLLPLRRRLDAALRRSDELAHFARELAGLRLASSGSPAALNDAGRRLIELLSERMPGVSLAFVRRGRDGKAAVAAQKGQVWSRALGGRLEPAAAELANLGVCAHELCEWGDEPGSSGWLAAADFDPAGRNLAAGRGFLEVAATAASTLASLADALGELASARARLEGGLTSAMSELSSTHSLLIQKSREVKTLHDVAATLTSRSSQEALSAVVGIIAKYLEADLVAFLLLDEATGDLVAQPGAYGVESEEQLYRIPLAQEKSSSVRVFKTGRPFMTPDAQNDPAVLRSYAQLWKIHSLLVVPVRRDGRPVGVLRVGSAKKDYFSSEQLALLSVIADEAGILLETASLNKKLAENAEQLKALNRMKDDFVSTVSHEFKTPLTTLMGFLTVMLEGDTGPLTDQQTRFLTVSKTAVKRLAQMVSELLDLSKLEGAGALELSAVSLEELAAASVEAQKPNAEAQGKRLSFSGVPAVPRVLGDARWLGLVVDNLVSNAVKFTRPGGTISVRLADKGDFVQVTVEDDGVGIPAEDQEHIFERFYRARNHKDVGAPGTGLGLAIARQVCAKHGGRIWFDSKQNEGTRFHFIVPVARQSEAVA